jgi:hypothetical protein
MANDFDDLFRSIKKDRAFVDYYTRIVNKEFREAKNEALRALNYHPVTIEIEKGAGNPEFPNISGTLQNLSSTNLWSFIGFDDRIESNPPDEIRKMIADSNYFIINSKIGFNIPTAEQIFAATPMPWNGNTARSWAKGIESGISGLNYFLRKASPQSHSGFGLQSLYQARSGYRFKPVPYVSAIIKQFNARVRKFEGQTI